MNTITLPVPAITHEELCLALARTRYLEGRTDVEEFEREVEWALKGNLSPILGECLF